MILAAAAAFATTLASAGDAAAAGPVTPTGKGIVGGALLGGEVVTITMGAAGVSRGWPYFVFGGLAAVGGGVGGFFVEKATKGTADASGTVTGGTPEPALYMLAGGMALLIPALVVSLNATAYKPPESDRNEPAGNEPSKDGVKVTPPGAAPPPGTTRLDKKVRPNREFAAIPHIPVSLVDVYKGKINLGLPALEVRPLYSQQEMVQYGVAQGTEVRLPVFKAMF
ncbi:MAG: hypothetical protein QM820_56165 [Minicystis sp.]